MIDRRIRVNAAGTALGGRLSAVLLAAILSLCSAVVCAEQSSPAAQQTVVGPHPDFSPQQVVRIQLAALQNNDALDRGIEICFRFASPTNKRQTGPLPRFIRMIENGPYSLMLRYRDAVFEPMEVSGRLAKQTVTLFGEGEAMTFTFHLGQQAGEACRDCWMTEAVTTADPDQSA